MRAVLRVACVVVAASSSPAASEPGPIGRWLMKEPVSLWDKGVSEASEMADSAAEGIGAHRGERAWGWAAYDWEDNEITLNFNVTGYKGDPTHKECNMLRRYFIGWLAHGDYSYTGTNEERSRRGILRAISQWFGHSGGYRNRDRDKNLEEKLARIIFVRVRLWNPIKSVTCGDRIMSREAPSTPIGVAPIRR